MDLSSHPQYPHKNGARTHTPPAAPEPGEAGGSPQFVSQQANQNREL